MKVKIGLKGSLFTSVIMLQGILEEGYNCV